MRYRCPCTFGRAYLMDSGRGNFKMGSRGGPFTGWAAGDFQRDFITTSTFSFFTPAAGLPPQAHRGQQQVAAAVVRTVPGKRGINAGGAWSFMNQAHALDIICLLNNKKKL